MFTRNVALVNVKTGKILKFSLGKLLNPDAVNYLMWKFGILYDCHD